MEPRIAESLLLAGLNQVSPVNYAELPRNLTIEQIGLDSISLSQLVLFIEDELGHQMPDELLVRISEAATVADVLAAFQDSGAVGGDAVG